jgi:hypothetical protein
MFEWLNGGRLDEWERGKDGKIWNGKENGKKKGRESGEEKKRDGNWEISGWMER